MENTKTGYPHIDKPWMKYYEGLEYNEDKLNTNLVEVLKERNKNRMTMPAYEYFKETTSYDEMFYEVDNASKVLSELGVKKGDIILSLVPNMPDDDHIFLGANQIGATLNYADPMPGIDNVASARKLFSMIASEKEKALKNGYDLRYIITLDKVYLSMIKPIEDELKELGINDVILLDMTHGIDQRGYYEFVRNILNYGRLNLKVPLVKDSITTEELQQILHMLNNMQIENEQFREMIKSSTLRIHCYNDLLRDCKNSKFEVVKDPDLIAYIGHTSGTSGAIPKGINITNKNIYSSMIQCDKGGLGPKENESVLHMLPDFAVSGRITNSIQSYYSRAMNIHLPEFPLDNFGYPIMMLKPNYIMAPPAFLVSLLNNPYLKDEDMSYITHIFYVGDAMRWQDEEKLNEFLKNHNSSAVIEEGYGLSETTGGAAYARGDYKRPNSIGIPLPGTTFGIVNPEVKEKLEPLKFEEGNDTIEGELVIKGNQTTDGLFAPAGKVVYQKMPGTDDEYLRTGDIATMDKDGIFYSKGRKDRGFIRHDGYNVRPYEIEPEIESNKYVKNARIVPYYDETRCGNMPICHITLNDESISEEEQIKVVEDIVYNTIIANPNMDTRQIPAKFKIRKSMPLSNMNKISFKALEEEGLSGDEINVEVHQTNIAIDGIDIYRNEKSKQKIRKRIK